MRKDSIYHEVISQFGPPLPDERWSKLSANDRDKIYQYIVEATQHIHKKMKIGLLEKYSMFLCKNGYMDTDWRDEEPFAIDEFLKTE